MQQVLQARADMAADHEVANDHALTAPEPGLLQASELDPTLGLLAPSHA